MMESYARTQSVSTRTDILLLLHHYTLHSTDETFAGIDMFVSSNCPGVCLGHSLCLSVCLAKVPSDWSTK